MSPDWSDLPPELLSTIAIRLTIYIDYIRFRAVCKNWKLSIPKTPNHLPCQLPWLMLPQSHNNKRTFLNLSENKYIYLNLPEPSHGKRICGSSQGWLTILDESPNVVLLNGITNAKVCLPDLTKFANVVDFNAYNIGREYTLRTRSGDIYYHNLREMRDSFIKKVVLSCGPLSAGMFIALAILNHTGDLVFCRKGDESWTSIEDAQFYCEDVLYYKGMIYAVNKIGRIAMCDVNDGILPRVSIIETPWQIIGDDMQYLVNYDEDLYFVSRFLDIDFDVEPDGPEMAYKTIRFDVFKLDMGKSGPRWERAITLGDRALFLGGNSSLCLEASDFQGCKGNCIYFTDDYSESNYDGLWGDYDLGIFNLDDGSIEPLISCPRNSRSGSRRPPPLWVTPNPC